MERQSKLVGLVACVSVLGLVGCVPEVDVELPLAAEDVASLIVLALPPSGAPGADAPDGRRWVALAGLRGVERALALPRGGRVVVLHYRRTLDELGLVAGLIPAVEPGASSRGLPVADARWSAAVGDGAPAWAALPEGEVPALSLAAFFAEDCAAAGGCATAEPGGAGADDIACAIPCPEPTSPTAPTPPAALVPPRETTCPDGWAPGAETSLGGSLCAPRLEPRAHCPSGHRLSLEAGACVPIGGDCPVDHFGPAPPADRPTFYVDAGAGAGGDGSRAAPFARLGDALGAVPDGARIVLACGAVHAAVDLRGRHRLHLRGAAARTTTVSGPFAVVGSTDVVLSNLTLAPDPAVGVALTDSGVRMEGAILHAGARGLTLSGASTATLTGVRVDDAAPAADPAAIMISVAAGAALYARDSHLDAARGRALAVTGRAGDTPAVAQLGGVVVRGSRGPEAVHASDGGRIEGEALLIVDAAAVALDVERDATSTLDHLVVDGVRGAAHGAIFVSAGGRATLTHLAVARVEGASSVEVASGALTVEDAVLFGDARTNGGGPAVLLTDAHLTLKRVLLEGHGSRGVAAYASELDAEDLGITAGAHVESEQVALSVEGRSAVSARRTRITRARASAIHVYGGETGGPVVELEDLAISHTTTVAGDDSSLVVDVQGPATVTLRRADVRDSSPAVIGVVRPEASLTVEDLYVSRSHFSGLLLRGGSTADVRRAHIEDIEAEGVYVSAAELGFPVTATLEDLVVRGRPELPVRRALQSLGTVHLDVRRFRLAWANEGLEIAEVGPTATDGLIEHATVGLELSPILDPAAALDLLRRVRFGDGVPTLVDRP